MSNAMYRYFKLNHCPVQENIHKYFSNKLIITLSIFLSNLNNHQNMTILHITTQKDENCVDLKDEKRCNRYASKGFCETAHVQYMKKNCKKTCAEGKKNLEDHTKEIQKIDPHTFEYVNANQKSKSFKKAQAEAITCAVK